MALLLCHQLCVTENIAAGVPVPFTTPMAIGNHWRIAAIARTVTSAPAGGQICRVLVDMGNAAMLYHTAPHARRWSGDAPAADVVRSLHGLASPWEGALAMIQIKRELMCSPLEF